MLFSLSKFGVLWTLCSEITCTPMELGVSPVGVDSQLCTRWVDALMVPLQKRQESEKESLYLNGISD